MYCVSGVQGQKGRDRKAYGHLYEISSEKSRDVVVCECFRFPIDVLAILGEKVELKLVGTFKVSDDGLWAVSGRRPEGLAFAWLSR